MNRLPIGTLLVDTLSRKLIDAGAIMAGGQARVIWCIWDDDFPASAILPADDIDFWFNDEDVYERCKAIVQDTTSDGFISANGIRYHWNGMAYNLIRPDVRPFKDVADLLESFDFTVAQAAVDSLGLVTTYEFESDVRSRKLVFTQTHSINDPLESMTRVLKYAAKGFVYDKNMVVRLFSMYSNLTSSAQQELINKFNHYQGESYS